MSTGDPRHARRKLLLDELGLTPLWRARAAGRPEAVDIRPTAIEDSAVQTGSRQADTSHVDVLKERRAEILRMGWEQLQASVAGCVACPLCESRSRTVFGVGDPNADWLCVGEGPGAQEDATGEPFVGPAGHLLDNMLAAIDLKRGRNVFITNIVKCRPPGNREPAPDEADRCEPYLARQIELIRPKLIIALGKTAASNLLHTNASLSSLRGRLHQYLDIPVIVTYHPAYLLRNLPAKAMVWEDLCFARSTMTTLLQLEN
ncbi:uracil-DNA glycosylase [Nitrosospira sp. Is2]|uniref:uracil-DNA glycosylase n=1 Tax=Nitrosospira sp. Is2 TaxID=3080532 RepID=UPI002953EF0E|nr:uracil-DNA glycosylase [Nitrosospira sp. Is2]WON74592.1 uracil-DNA glycosylase [Nitrosospira sp. Is2]